MTVAEPAVLAFPPFDVAASALEVRMVYGAFRSTDGHPLRSGLPGVTIYRLLDDYESVSRIDRSCPVFEDRFPEMGEALRSALAIGGYPAIPRNPADGEMLTFREAKRALVERIAYNGSRAAGSPGAAARRGLVMASLYRHLQALDVPLRMRTEGQDADRGSWGARQPFAALFPYREATLVRALALGGYPAYCPPCPPETQLVLAFSRPLDGNNGGSALAEQLSEGSGSAAGDA